MKFHHSTRWLLPGCAIILALSLGVRHAFGLFLQPMSLEFGWGRETFAFAIALQNLVWGLVQPFAGAFADRYGVRPTVLVTALAYVAGLALMSVASSPGVLYLSTGLLIGFGLSGTSFAVLLSVVGRSVAPEKRSMAMGIASAAGSFGQFAMLPGTLGLIEWLGWSAALLACAMLIMLIVPLVPLLREKPLHDGSGGQRQALGAALLEAGRHKPFWWLSLGYFVCGFQVVFIGVHIPSYLIDQQSVGTNRDHGAGTGRPVQHCRHLGCRLARRTFRQTPTAGHPVFQPFNRDQPVHLPAIERNFRLPVRHHHGAALAVDGAADQRHHCHAVWRTAPVDAGRHRLSVPPAGLLCRRLAGRLGV